MAESDLKYVLEAFRRGGLKRQDKCLSCGLMSVVDGICTECGAKEE